MKRLIRKSHFDNVDALRFLAFLAIFMSHCFITNNQQLDVSSLFSDLRQVTANLNSAAYSLLFILTGFLNTWSIFEERFIYKRMNVLRFYVRRALSLLPLYFVIFLLGYFLLPGIKTGFENDLPSTVSAGGYLSFLFNFSYDGASSPLYRIMGNMWSVAVMVQLVIVWPLLMNYFRRNETWLFLLGMLAFTGSAWFFAGEESFRFNTLNILCDFISGAYLAYFSFFKYRLYGRLKQTSRRTIGMIYLLFAAFILFRSQVYLRLSGDLPVQLIFIIERLLVTAALTFFIFEQNFSSNSLLKLAKLKIFNRPGRMSYGLYVWHATGIIAGYYVMNFLFDKQTAALVILFEPFIALIITFVLAKFSYEFIEKRFVNLKKNYQPSREYNPVGLDDIKTKSA